MRGLAQADAERLVAARAVPYRTPGGIMRRAGLKRGAMATLAAADAFRSLGLDRRQALWAVAGLADDALPLFAGLGGGRARPSRRLPAMALGEQVAKDYATLGLSLKRHPLALLRPTLDRARVVPATRSGAASRRPTASRSPGSCWCASVRAAPAASSS